ncbi:hypothetical protein HMPREF1326_00574 [Akkermansia sp. KLE1605]|nr:hypothetical protein HMPREF1326_00574 [Akkermansia sp. KLE1605]
MRTVFLAGNRGGESWFPGDFIPERPRPGPFLGCISGLRTWKVGFFIPRGPFVWRMPSVFFLFPWTEYLLRQRRYFYI